MHLAKCLPKTTVQRSFPALGALLFLASAAHAGVLIDPVSATSNLGTDGVAVPDNVRNQTALTPTYISGATELNAYLATNPVHNGVTSAGTPPVAVVSNAWISSGATTGSFDFNLGASMTIDAFLFWNLGLNYAVDTDNVQGFTLLAADNPVLHQPHDHWQLHLPSDQ